MNAYNMLQGKRLNEETKVIRIGWSKVLDIVRKDYDISRTSFSTWLSDLYVGWVYRKKVYLCSFNNNVNANMTNIKTKYGIYISKAFEEIFGKGYEILFVDGNESYEYNNSEKVSQKELQLESHNVLSGKEILLDVGQTLLVDGSKDLSSIIMFGKGGCVYEITLRKPDRSYLLGEDLYIIEVLAQGSAGAFSANGRISFWDLTDQKYELCIISESKKVHTVMFNSKKPQITKIEWTYYSQHT